MTDALDEMDGMVEDEDSLERSVSDTVGSGINAQPRNADFWTGALKARPEFAGGESCWDAVDCTGPREPLIARTLTRHEGTTPDSADCVLSALMRVWLPKPPVPIEERVPFSYALLQMHYDPLETPNHEKVLEAKRQYNKVRSMLSSLLLVYDLESRPSHDPTFSRGTGTKFGTTTLHAFHRLSVVLKLSKGLVINDLRYRSIDGPQASSMLSTYASPWEDFIPSVNGTNLLTSTSQDSWGGNGKSTRGQGRNSSSRNEQKELEPHQLIILGVLKDLRKNCYSLMEGDSQGRVWKQIFYGNQATHAWRPVCPMLDFVRDWGKIVDNLDKWKLLTHSRSWNDERIAKHLVTQPFDQFLPRRKMCRTAWSFRNGVYYVDKVQNFFEFSSGRVPEELVSCKFMDQHFEPTWPHDDYEKIIGYGDFKLSCVQLLENQEYTLLECFDILALLGRAIFPLGLMDHYDAFLAFIGQGGTGKSSIVNQLKMLFPKSFVRSFSGKERTFGMSGLEDAWLVITTEITPELLNQMGEILQWVAGEQVAIAKKNKDQVMAKIRAHLVACGNSFNFRDTGGNINRRTIACQFNNKPAVPDTHLKVRQRKEIGRFLVLVVRLYLDLRQRVGKGELIRVLQPKFRATRRTIISQINPIISFLHNSEEIFTVGGTTTVRAKFMSRGQNSVDTNGMPYLPFDLFMSMVKQHASAWNVQTKPDFSEASVSFACEEFGLYKLSQCKYLWWESRHQGSTLRSNFVTVPSPENSTPISCSGPLLVGVGIKKFAEMYKNLNLGILEDGLSAPRASLTSSGSSTGSLSSTSSFSSTTSDPSSSPSTSSNSSCAPWDSRFA